MRFVGPNGERGKKGGLSEYARQVGKSESALRYLKDSAMVYKNLALECEVSLLEKAKHLSAISKTPESYWQTLVELLIEKDWTVKQTDEICRAVRDIQIPEYYRTPRLAVCRNGEWWTW